MSDFDPGPGWREVTEREWLSTPIDADHLELASNGKIRHWVREVPVPALPTDIATLDGADLIFVSEVLRALGVWKRAQR